MILLDTNVISAVMLPAPPAAVVAWLNRQPARALFLTVITLAEIGYGIALLPDGRRRRDLTNRFEQYVGEGSPAGWCRSTRQRPASTAR